MDPEVHLDELLSLAALIKGDVSVGFVALVAVSLVAAVAEARPTAIPGSGATIEVPSSWTVKINGAELTLATQDGSMSIVAFSDPDSTTLDKAFEFADRRARAGASDAQPTTKERGVGGAFTGYVGTLYGAAGPVSIGAFPSPAQHFFCVVAIVRPSILVDESAAKVNEQEYWGALASLAVEARTVAVAAKKAPDLADPFVDSPSAPKGDKTDLPPPSSAPSAYCGNGGPTCSVTLGATHQASDFITQDEGLRTLIARVRGLSTVPDKLWSVTVGPPLTTLLLYEPSGEGFAAAYQLGASGNSSPTFADSRGCGALIGF